MKISQNIKFLRKKKKITQQDLSNYLHVSRKTISGWENDRSFPDIQSVIKLSELFDVSTDKLLNDDSLIRHYNNESKINNKHIKMLKISYFLNIIMVALAYLHMFRLPGFTSILITLLLVLNIIYFLNFYNDYNNLKNRKSIWAIVIAYIFILILNLFLNLFNYSFMNDIRNNDAFVNVGSTIGILLLSSFISISIIIIIINFFKVNKDKYN